MICSLNAFVNYESWRTGVSRKYLLRSLRTTDYNLKKTVNTRNEELEALAERKWGDIQATPESAIEKLGLWVYSHDLDWKRFGRQYIKSVNLARWMYIRQTSFLYINHSVKEEIELITDGYIKVEEWGGLGTKDWIYGTEWRHR